MLELGPGRALAPVRSNSDDVDADDGDSDDDDDMLGCRQSRFYQI